MRTLPLLLLAGLTAACGRPSGDAPPPPADAAPRTLATPAAPGSAQPHVAPLPGGGVVLSWVEPGPDSTHALRMATLEGDGWSAPRTVASGRDWFVNWADFPSVVALGDGRMAAHWLQKTGGSTYAYAVRLRLSDDGGATWGAPITPHSDTSDTEHGFVSMWPAADGALGVAWLDGRAYAGDAPTKEMAVMAARVSADGGVGAETRLDARACDCCQTGVAVTARGPLLVYRDRSADEVRDIAVVRWADGAWTAPRTLHADGWRIEACPVNGPQAAADGERVAAAWYTAAHDTARVLVAFSNDAGETFSAPVRVDGGRPLGRVDVELLDGGAAVVAWLEAAADGAGAEVRLRRVAADGAAGAPVVVARSGAQRASGFPRMARAGSRLVLAWVEPGDSATAVRTAVLDTEGLR